MPFVRNFRLGVALSCADWRLHHVQANFNSRLAETLDVEGVNTTALPGPDGLILPHRENELAVVAGWIKLHIKVHDPRVLAVVAHQRCAGHPVSDSEHEIDAVRTARALKERTGFAGPMIAVLAAYRHEFHWDLNVLEHM